MYRESGNSMEKYVETVAGSLCLMMVLFYFINRIICLKTYRIYPKFLY